LAFSPDGRILAVSGAGNTVRLWDVATHQPLKTLSGNQGPVYSLAFSPDGRTLATGSADQTVRLWNVATGQLQITISAPTGGGKLVAFSPDGHTLAATDDSSDHGDTLRLWAISPLNQARAISKICHAVHRDLTAQERSTYLPGAPANRACRS
jgi:WD40 repeat protein